MNLVLRRREFKETGIFGALLDENGAVVADTIEHAYPSSDMSSYVPKVRRGVYSCVRGHHELHSGPIETFEVKGVPGHSGILFHCGNDESVSEGCILVGSARIGDHITESKAAFAKFMQLQEGVDEFTLTVENP